MQNAIDKIVADNTSGAAEILCRAADIFSLLSPEQTGSSSLTVEQARKTVLDTSVALVLAQPDMSPLLRLASAAVGAARNAGNAADVFRSAQKAARGFIADAELAGGAAASHAAKLIPNGATVLTHSRSSTVLVALIEARRQGKDFSVIATESRPMLEGRASARKLAAEGVHVSLIADAAAAQLMDEVNLVLVGADKVTPEYLLNKIGTRMIALAARERAVPAYAVCDTSKFIAADYFSGSNLYRSSDELWPDAPPGVAVVNRYFEPVPLALFAAIIAEDGELSADETARRTERASIDRVLIDALARYRSRC